MKKLYICLFVSLISTVIAANNIAMYQWQSHLAYGSVSQIVDAGSHVFGLTNGALFSVNKSTEEISTYTKQDGLHGADIVTIAFDETSNTVIIVYVDGLIDLLRNDQIIVMTDLQQKTMSASKRANKIIVEKGIAYFCMPFGIMAVDIKKQVIKDTYYIGENGADVNVLDMALAPDSVYAISSSTRYSVAREANWMDYSNWSRTAPLSKDSSYQAIVYWQDKLFMLVNHVLMQRNEQEWVSPCPDCYFFNVCPSSNKLFLITSGSLGIYYLDKDFLVKHTLSPYEPQSIVEDGASYWLATANDGIVLQTSSGTQSYAMNGPMVNIPYRMRFCGDKMVMVTGGYYVEMTYQAGAVMMYENDKWSGFNQQQLLDIAQKGKAINVCDAIIDPNDPTHFYASSLGGGLWEFRNNQPYAWYYSENSDLDNIVVPADEYTWVDGLAYDSQGNLWMINIANKRNIKVLTPTGQWVAIDHAAANTMQRARDLLIWNQNENLKIITVNHTQSGLLLLNDNGTISDQSDDQCVFKSEFVDQDNQRILLSGLYSITQDKTGALWIGTEAGVVVIDDPSSLLTGNSCRKIKIPRNDGTGLADYLLGTEQINAIVTDGANRKWIGTAASGLYLVSEDGLETIHHFTTDNSPLIDNAIISLAIQPSTGKVFIGTGKGLMSYQNDAAPAAETFSGVYAYPNPVRPGYNGVITIRGLMDETIVHITDAAGNLVCETRSNGGLAIWDGKTADGRRAASGVYTVFLNETESGKHAVTKILLMH